VVSSSDNGTYDFDFSSLEPIVKTIKHRNGKVYFLKEADEDLVCKWQNMHVAAAKMADGKVVGVSGVADAEPVLVAGCLKEVIYASDGTVKQEKVVTVQEVRSWSHKIIKPLFEEAKRISGLDDNETPEFLEAQIKNFQDKLNRVKGGNKEDGGETPLGNSSDATTDSSE
jgi:hypothetical protein